jgi:hypothetical protein
MRKIVIIAGIVNFCGGGKPLGRNGKFHLKIPAIQSIVLSFLHSKKPLEAL